jgi:hypothetical protein
VRVCERERERKGSFLFSYFEICSMNIKFMFKSSKSTIFTTWQLSDTHVMEALYQQCDSKPPIQVSHVAWKSIQADFSLMLI